MVFKFLVIYLSVGTFWSFFKWFLFVKEEIRSQIATKIKYKYPFSDMTPPSPSSHIDDIVRWILTWPISLSWAILEDLCVWVGKQIYCYTGRIYETISQRVFDNLMKNNKL